MKIYFYNVNAELNDCFNTKRGKKKKEVYSESETRLHCVYVYF